MPPGYRPGRDDTRWARLARELHAAHDADPDAWRRERFGEWVLAEFEPHLARSAELNDRYAGRWHVWFAAQGTDTVEWLARPAGNGDPLLTAATADGLVALIEEAER